MRPCAFLDAQENITFTHLTIEQGLSLSSINCIAEDKWGFVWFGTQDGLNRFDGRTFKVYRSYATDSTTLSNNFIHCLFADDDWLWVGTDRGLDRYSTIDGKFERMELSYRVTAIEHHQDNRFLWLGSVNGLVKFDKTTRTATRLASVQLPNPEIRALHADTSGFLWIGTSAGLSKVRQNDVSVVRTYVPSSSPDSLRGGIVHRIIRTSGGQLKFATNHGLSTLDNKSGKISTLTTADGLSNNVINDILEVSPDVFWLTTDNGLSIIAHESMRVLREEPSKPGALQSNFLSRVAATRDGSVWVGSFNQGIHVFNPRRVRFAHIKRGNLPGELPNGDVWAFVEDLDGTVWIGTSEGLAHLQVGTNPESREKSKYYRQSSSKPNSLGHNRVWALARDNAGRLWVGSDGGLSRIVRNFDGSVTFENFTPESSGLPDNRVTSILPMADDLLLLGTSGGGVVLFNTRTREVRQFVNDPANPRSLSHNRILCLRQDSFGKVWIGTSGGGISILDTNYEITRLADIDPVAKITSGDRITCLQKTQDDAMWFGTLGAGLVRWKTNEPLKRFNERDGLPNNTIYGILEDSGANLWVSTNRGLCRLSPETGRINTFDLSDGLQSIEFNSGASYKLSDGRMLFGGVNGANIFHPDSLFSGGSPPRVVLKSLKIKNESPVHIAPDGGEINLQYSDNVLVFDFAVLDYAHPELNRVMLKLTGFDTDWSIRRDRHDVTYTNLDPGRYVLQLKGATRSGEWSDPPTELVVNITPPFWRSWWFRSFVVLFVFLSLVVVHRVRTRHIQARNVHLQAMVSERTKSLEKALTNLKEANDALHHASLAKSSFLASMSHELRTPLNSIIGFTDLLRQELLGPISHEQRDALNDVSESSHSLLEIINDILDLSKVEAGKMALRYGDVRIDETIQHKLAELSPLIKQKNLTIDLKMNGELPVIEADGAKLSQIMTNLIGNAVKFTPPGGRIIVGSRPVDRETVEISVEDTGVGIAPGELATIFDEFRQASSPTETKGTGLGLALAKRFTELHGGKIWAESDGRNGSRFVLHLPVRKWGSVGSDKTEPVP